MGKFRYEQVSAFSLEGKFLGFEFEDGYKRKYLRIENSEGEYCVKLAKYLRVSFELNLTSGDWIQIFGEKKFNSKKGTLKLKAERVICAAKKQAQSPVPVRSKPAKAQATILVCQKSDCMKRGGKAVCQALQEAIGDRGLENEVAIKGTGCLKQCKAGPNLVVMPDKTRYSRIQAEQIPELIDQHFLSENVDEQNAKLEKLVVVGTEGVAIK